ncbi:MAG: hypothetical protein ACE5KT_05965, partial [Methanosarcinales archaeon]
MKIYTRNEYIKDLPERYSDPIVGRNEELERFKDFLKNDDYVFLCYGVDGVGKTRLFIEFAKILEDTDWRGFFLAKDLVNFEEVARELSSDINKLILFIDDAQIYEPIIWNSIDRIREKFEKVKMVINCRTLYKDEIEIHLKNANIFINPIELKPISKEGLTKILENLLPDFKLSENDKDKIINIAQGIPIYAKIAVGYVLATEGSVDLAEGNGWRASLRATSGESIAEITTKEELIEKVYSPRLEKLQFIFPYNYKKKLNLLHHLAVSGGINTEIEKNYHGDLYHDLGLLKNNGYICGDHYTPCPDLFIGYLINQLVNSNQWTFTLHPSIHSLNSILIAYDQSLNKKNYEEVLKICIQKLQTMDYIDCTDFRSLLTPFYAILRIHFAIKAEWLKEKINNNWLIEVYEKCKETTDKEILSTISNNMGLIFYELKKYYESEEWYIKAWNLREYLKDKGAYVANNYGLLLYKTKKY